MQGYIPFVTSDDTFKLANEFYGDAEIVHTPLDLAERRVHQASRRLWIDPGVDGLVNLGALQSDNGGAGSPWYALMSKAPGFDKIAEQSFASRPDARIVQKFVGHILDRCAKLSPTPAWISVPQLPYVDNSDRNKINRALARATGEWKASWTGTVRLILPVIFTNQRQVNLKTARKPKLELAKRCYSESQADGFWAVDSSLTDDSGSKTLRNTRFPGLIAMHQELNELISSKIRIAGPYWAMNLVLWARDLVDYPGIGVGGGYRYLLPGGPSHRGSSRIAIPSLRRRLVYASVLKAWFEKSLAKIGSGHSAYGEFRMLEKQLPHLQAEDSAKRQVARFYRSWLDLVLANPFAGRSMALFQDLSSAYALGRALPDLGRNENTAHRPESVAEPLMLSCL